ncbi:hypothetical protein BGX28_009157 [Mortierella sp. GBA30]|nr:hypothetical protein BGX28_009157 [Mortierella sp. GBA30]
MKTCFKTLFLVSLTCLQHLSGAQAQLSTPSSTTTAKSSATSGVGVAPSPPTFVNTPGLRVTTPYNGMTIPQDTVLSISASLAGERPISSIKIMVAKKDGSSNTTIVDVPSGAILSISQTWNVTSTQYPVGEYIMNMIITPNMTANLGGTAPMATTTQSIGSFLPIVTSVDSSPQPTGLIPGPIPGAASVYYFQATVRVIAKLNSTNPNSSAMGMKFGSNGDHGFVGLFVAASIALLGSFFAL